MDKNLVSEVDRDRTAEAADSPLITVLARIASALEHANQLEQRKQVGPRSFVH